MARFGSTVRLLFSAPVQSAFPTNPHSQTYSPRAKCYVGFIPALKDGAGFSPRKSRNDRLFSLPRPSSRMTDADRASRVASEHWPELIAEAEAILAGYEAEV